MDKAGKKKAVGAELIIPVAAVAYAVYYVYTILDYPMEAQINGLFLAGVLCTLVAILLVRTAIQWFRGEVTLNMTAVIAPLNILPARVGFLLLTIGFAIAIRWIGLHPDDLALSARMLPDSRGPFAPDPDLPARRGGDCGISVLHRGAAHALPQGADRALAGGDLLRWTLISISSANYSTTR